MFYQFFMTLVASEQFNLDAEVEDNLSDSKLNFQDLAFKKNNIKSQLLNEIETWFNKKSENLEEQDQDAYIDHLMQELEKEQDEVPIEWVEAEQTGPSRILRINKPSKALITLIHQFYFDVWHLSREYVDVLIPYHQFTLIADLISENSPDSVFQVLVTDVDEMMSELGQYPYKSESTEYRFDPKTWFDDYHPFEAIVSLFDEWLAAHDDVMTKHFMGYSYEKREINAYHIKPFPKYKGERKRIYIQSLIHAREWVGGSTLQFIAWNILLKKETKEWEKIEFILNPVANPDGYVYTWEQNRLWRKNRRPTFNGEYGVDLNRNFEANWGQGTEDAPGLKDPKSEIYCGATAESESETKAIADYIRGLEGVQVFLTLHSYSQLILRPPCSSSEPSIWEKRLKEIGNDIRQSIRGANGKIYTSQTAYDLYFTSGTSVEWVFMQKWKGSTNYFRTIPYVIELRPRPSFFGYGFLLPASQIKPTGTEIWASINDVLIEEALSGGLIEEKVEEED